ncbi:MAG: acyltransferase family protein [Chloroflexota bacterium]
MSKRFLLLNGLAIINVVLNHSIGWTYVAMFWWVHRYTNLSSPDFSQLYSGAYFFLRVLEQWVIPSIPAFLMVSGYFASFSAGKKKLLGWNFVITRVKYLAIPYFLWSTLMIIFNVFQNTNYTATQLVRMYLTGQAAEAYYFVPLLISLYLLSPVLIRLANWNWKFFLGITALIQVLTKLADYPVIMGENLPLAPFFSFINSGWLFIGHFFWFSFGMIIGIRQSDIKETFRKVRWHLLIISLVFFVAGIIEWEWLLLQSGKTWIGPHETLVDNIYSFTILSAFLGFWSAHFPFSKKMEELGPKSFGVFLANSLFLIIAARGIYHFIPQLLAFPLIFLMILVIIGLSTPLILMKITRSSFLKPIYTYLFG